MCHRNSRSIVIPFASRTIMLLFGFSLSRRAATLNMFSSTPGSYTDRSWKPFLVLGPFRSTFCSIDGILRARRRCRESVLFHSFLFFQSAGLPTDAVLEFAPADSSLGNCQKQEAQNCVEQVVAILSLKHKNHEAMNFPEL